MKYYWIVAALFSLLFSNQIRAQLYSEDFSSTTENTGIEGSSGGTLVEIGDYPANVLWSLDTANGASLTASSDYAKVTGGVFEVQDVDGYVTWTSPATDISGESSVAFSLLITETGDLETGDLVLVEYSTDGGVTYDSVLNWNAKGSSSATLIGDAPDDGDWVSETVSQGGLTGTSFVLKVTLINNAGTEQIQFDNILLTSETALAAGFEEETSQVTETDATSSFSVPVVLTNYGGSQVDFDVSVTGGTAEPEDYRLNTTSLSFTSATLIDISIDINSDADMDMETIELTLVETTSTGVSVNPSVHTITINDDEIAELVISEIHYNPNGDLGFDDAAYEYFEIYNAGDETINLKNYSVLDGVSITFSENDSIMSQEYIVIARDSASYNGNGYTVIEWSSGSLTNTGESLTLTDSSGATVDEVTYSPSGASTTNGDGYSYEIVDVNSDNALTTENWLPSALINGSPGSASDVTLWEGTAGSDWSNSSNWSNGIPNAMTNAVIQDTLNDPILNSVAAVANLVIDSAASLTVNSGAGLAIYATVTNDGSYMIKRGYIGSAGLSIIGSPVESMSIAELGADFVFSFDGTDYSSNLKNSSNNLTAARGYFVAYTGASDDISFSGTPNSGDYAYNIDESNFELIANPYSAAISADSLIKNNTDIAGAIYFWDDGGANSGINRGGDYRVANAIGITSTSDLDDGINGNKGSIYDGFIRSGQGFYVEAIANGAVSFTADMQISSSGSNSDAGYYRKQDDKVLKLALENRLYYNELIVGLVLDATQERDRIYDAPKYSGTNQLSFYSLISDQKYAIQGLPLNASSVRLGFDALQSGTYELTMKDFSGFNDQDKVALIDSRTGTAYELNEKFSVSVELEEGQNNDRFTLVFGSQEAQSLKEDIVSIAATDQAITISDTKASGMSHLKIHSLEGRLILAEEVEFVDGSTSLPISLDKNTIYVLRLDDLSYKFILE